MIRTVMTYFVIALLSGCTFLDSSISNQLEAARAKWTGANLADYEFDYDGDCRCQINGAFVIRVTADSVVAVTDANTGASLTATEAAVFPTVSQLLSQLERHVNSENPNVTATFDATLGYPRTADLNYQDNPGDGEISYTVTQVKIIN